MFDFVKKLLFAKQLKFEEGTIELLGAYISMVPVDVLAKLTKYLNDEKTGYQFYESAMNSVDYYVDAIEKRYHVKDRKLLEIMIKVGTLGGWGKIKLSKYNPENKIISFSILEQPLARVYKQTYGESEKPIDHMLRGLITGSVRKIFNDNTLEGVETKCIGTGSAQCEVTIQSIERFTPQMIKPFEDQLNPSVISKIVEKLPPPKRIK